MVTISRATIDAVAGTLARLQNIEAVLYRNGAIVQRSRMRDLFESVSIADDARGADLVRIFSGDTEVANAELIPDQVDFQFRLSA